MEFSIWHPQSELPPYQSLIYHSLPVWVPKSLLEMVVGCKPDSGTLDSQDIFSF